MPVEPTAAPTSDLTPEQLDWPQFVRAGQYRRALAAARLSGAGAEVQDALERLFGLEEAVRSRQYDQSLKELSSLEVTLQGSDLKAALDAVTLDAATLAQWRVALECLQQYDQQRRAPAPLGTTAAALPPTQALAPALACPLTRAEALNLLGVESANAGETQAALSSFEQAVEADPQHYRALSNLGNMALERGDLNTAEQYQRQAIALHDDFAAGHHNLGVVLRKQGKLSESVRHIKRSQRLSYRQAQQEKGPSSALLNPRVLRTIGLILAVVVFFWLMRGHH